MGGGAAETACVSGGMWESGTLRARGEEERRPVVLRHS